MSESARTVPAAPPGDVASLWRRIGALAIDWLASMLIARLIFTGIAYLSDEYSFGVLAVFAAEVIILTWLTGSSFGQRIVGIRVVRMDGGRLALWQVALRTALICLVIPAVVYDANGRGLHDRAAGSVVVLSRAAGHF
jgi:uncharacterized RDD family membrane protein YckC